MYGLQRTGTNVVRRLILANFRVTSLEGKLEWKHGPIQTPEACFDGEPVRRVLCVRDPYAWLRSCYRYFCRHKGADGTIDKAFAKAWSLERFIRSAHYTWETPMGRWNDLNRRWTAFHDRHPARCILIRSEDLLGPDEQVQQMQRVEQQLGLRRRGEWQTERRRINNRMRRTRKDMDWEYYRQRRYFEDYTPALLAFVRGRLDALLAGRLGYRIEAHPGARGHGA